MASFILQTAACSSSVCPSRAQTLNVRKLRCFQPAVRVQQKACRLQQRNAAQGQCNEDPSRQSSDHVVLSRRNAILLAALGACLSSDAALAQPPAAEGTTTVIPTASIGELSPSARQVYKLNRRIQTQNRLNDEFPVFVREGFNVKIIADNYQTTPDGLIYSVLQEGKGAPAKEGQQVIFDYVGYNESGSLIDSSYRQGKPAQATLGIGGVIPGFEIALKTMTPGSKWRVIIPPELGPPVGPSTFFSAKQCEVFDISVLDIKNCSRKPMLMFSQLVCE